MYTSGVFAYGIPLTWRTHVPVRLAFEAFQGFCSASLDRQHGLFGARHWLIPVLQHVLTGTAVAAVVVFATEFFRWGRGAGAQRPCQCVACVLP